MKNADISMRAWFEGDSPQFQRLLNAALVDTKGCRSYWGPAEGNVGALTSGLTITTESWQNMNQPGACVFTNLSARRGSWSESLKPRGNTFFSNLHSGISVLAAAVFAGFGGF